MCHFVLVFFSPFSIAITLLGEERANLSAFRAFVRFVLVWVCRFSLPLVVVGAGGGGLRFVIVALPGLFSYLFFILLNSSILVNKTLSNNLRIIEVSVITLYISGLSFVTSLKQSYYNTLFHLVWCI